MFGPFGGSGGGPFVVSHPGKYFIYCILYIKIRKSLARLLSVLSIGKRGVPA